MMCKENLEAIDPSSIEAMVVRFRMSKLEVAQREQDKDGQVIMDTMDRHG
jgi:hypothetical protein